ncbi:MAG: glucose-6-phosphate isomerase [Nocardioidaceae bacterium]|nr:glucose-6-phosphate isomerase [Nocardioidaceae bacterium]
MNELHLTIAVPDRTALDAKVAQLIETAVASRIAARDSTVWGPDAESEASIRLAWVDLAETSRPLVPEIEALRSELAAKGFDHVVLGGMGGSSLAPEVICAAASVDITILDSSDPDQVRNALADRLATSIVVISSKSGGTVETDSQKRAFEAAYRAAGHDPLEHIVIVTDPGSPLDESAREAGYRVFNADPEVGGRYSALTAFGLVPSGLAGAPIGQLLDEAASVADELTSDDPTNAALLLGTLIGTAAVAGVDKLVIADTTGNGVGDWIEQLVAESTGKQGHGVLPVVVPDTAAPNFTPATDDSILVIVGSSDVAESTSGYAAGIEGPLGAQMLLWEYATVIAGQIIGIDPFDQPDVESAKIASRKLLDSGISIPDPAFVDEGISAYGESSWLTAMTVAGAIEELLATLDPAKGYVAIQTYLDRERDASFAVVRETLAAKLGRPVTFGWGPRFLHSTGQYHKGGPDTGVYLQITATPDNDLEIPDRPFTFGEFITAQALGDGSVLEAKGRPVLRLHLSDRVAGLQRIREALL